MKNSLVCRVILCSGDAMENGESTRKMGCCFLTFSLKGAVDLEDGLVGATQS